MLSNTQNNFFNLIFNYAKINNKYPTLNEIKKISNYKSYNSIYRLLHVLEDKNYLVYNKKTKEITYLKDITIKGYVSTISFLNEKRNINICNLDNTKEYVAFSYHYNNLNNYCIQKGDILIIEKSLLHINNKLVLVLINDKYMILKYEKKDSFIYLSNDNNSYILNSFDNIIGKVKMVIRNYY